MLKVLVPVLSLPGAALSTKTKMPCSMPGCRKDAASPRAKFCMTCFKTNASLASAQRKAFRGGGVPGNRGNSKGAPGNRGNSKGAPGNRGNSKGAPGNRGNSGAQGVPGSRGNSRPQGSLFDNRGNTTAGRKKKLAGKRSALRRSTKLVRVVKTPWLDLILAKKEDVDLLVKSAQYECLACSAARQSC